MHLGSEEILEALHQTTYCLERPLAGPIPDASTFFAWEPLPWAIFLDGLRRAAPLVQGRRFLDVGCGIGTKLAFMHYLGWQVAGIDRHSPYIETAEKVAPFAQLTTADAFDVQEFDADLVYAYRPCVHEDLQLQLEDHLAAHMDAGAVLWLPCRPDSVRVI